MDRWVGQIAVVTGASSGIGEAIAKNLVHYGMIVVGLARRKTHLKSIQKSLEGEKGKFYPYECDVSVEENVAKAFKWVKETLGSVHVLVNNAGLEIPEKIIDMKTSDMKKIFDVNVIGLLHCTRQALWMMRETRFEGTIININSIQGHRYHQMPGIQFNVYPASKHAVTAIVEGLQHELREDKLRIRVTSISPGIVGTSIGGGILDSCDLPQLKPEDVASSVSYVLSVPQNVQITELTIKPLGEPF